MSFLCASFDALRDGCIYKHYNRDVLYINEDLDVRMTQCDIGLIGLAVMDQNLVLNMDEHGFGVAVYNRMTSKVDKFLNTTAKGTQIVGAYSLEELVGALKRPRRVMLMVKSGEPVDGFIELLILLLEERDIIIDGGSSDFWDSIRCKACEQVDRPRGEFFHTGWSGAGGDVTVGPLSGLIKGEPRCRISSTLS